MENTRILRVHIRILRTLCPEYPAQEEEEGAQIFIDIFRGGLGVSRP